MLVKLIFFFFLSLLFFLFFFPLSFQFFVSREAPWINVVFERCSINKLALSFFNTLGELAWENHFVAASYQTNNLHSKVKVFFFNNLILQRNKRRLEPLAKFTCLQTDSHGDGGCISTHAKCCLTERESGLVVMLTCPPGRQTDKLSHGSSLQLGSVCCGLCIREKHWTKGSLCVCFPGDLYWNNSTSAFHS